MDKDTFVREAPAYYALAIAITMASAFNRQIFTRRQLEKPSGFEDRLFYLDHSALVAAALGILSEAGVAEMISETFGPTLYRSMPQLTEDWLVGDAAEQFPIFLRYSQIQNLGWLSDAVKDVNSRYVELGISDFDFMEPLGFVGAEPLPSLWEPLPLDRSDELMSDATAKMDEAIARIEADNGYAENAPGERDYVLQSLKSFSLTLKESAQITGMQIKTFALDPLALVLKRFAGAAVGVVAGAAKDALVTWLKAKFGALLGALLSGS